eukprot:CAMPEP_0172509348 /NCGR_PEP_ID=MMETSP1066-20121228/219618_1 /TAXON_ID=671091 /ORGANISM="Coscinodiscus wailesii, Strain CCMP2513" /LENGTH=286 /DNA_ID=CAMNT_0013287785 /DNA_START=296 /DNA_END=1156 /DNA_ORIENTATION=+
MAHITTRESSGTIIIAPRDESKQSALVVICHGLGDTAEGFVDVAEHLSQQLPHVKFVLPTAPTQPVTMNMGMPMPSWYDIVGLDERSNEKCAGIDKSIAVVKNILKTEHETTALPYSRMLLGGFSQGGALTLFTGLTLPSAEQKLAGIVVMSGYLPGAQQFELTSGLETTPILHCHGTDDPLVQFPMAEKSKEYVTAKGATDYTLKSYAGMQHTVLPKEIADVLEFLQNKLPPDSSVCVKVKAPEEMSVKELKAAIRRAGLGSKAIGLMEKGEFVKLLKDFRDTGK